MPPTRSFDRVQRDGVPHERDAQGHPAAVGERHCLPEAKSPHCSGAAPCRCHVASLAGLSTPGARRRLHERTRAIRYFHADGVLNDSDSHLSHRGRLKAITPRHQRALPAPLPWDPLSDGLTVVWLGTAPSPRVSPGPVLAHVTTISQPDRPAQGEAADQGDQWPQQCHPHPPRHAFPHRSPGTRGDTSTRSGYGSQGDVQNGIGRNDPGRAASCSRRLDRGSLRRARARPVRAPSAPPIPGTSRCARAGRR
jgi:hypothetical protein